MKKRRKAGIFRDFRRIARSAKTIRSVGDIFFRGCLTRFIVDAGGVKCKQKMSYRIGGQKFRDFW